MIQQKDNQVLYKYYPPKKYVIEALSKGTICFTDLYSQNDPFEAMGFYRKTSDYESDNLFDSKLQSMMDDQYTEDDQSFLRNQCRIFCATSQYNRPLMWAHYAQSHRGICVGYHRQDIQKYCAILEGVKYRDHPLEKGFIYNEPERFLLLKATDWKYEKEVRGIYKIKRADCIVTPILSGQKKPSITYAGYDKKNIFFSTPILIRGTSSSAKCGEIFQAPRHIIKECAPCEVILGICISQWMEQRVRKICNEKQIPLYRAIQADRSFEIYKIPIDV